MAQKGMMTFYAGNVFSMQLQASSLSLWPGYWFEIHSGFAGGSR